MRFPKRFLFLLFVLSGVLAVVMAACQATYTAPDGRRWHADVVITIIDKQYTYGVLRVLPTTP